MRTGGYETSLPEEFGKENLAGDLCDDESYYQVLLSIISKIFGKDNSSEYESQLRQAKNDKISNLPATRQPFFGRKKELEALEKYCVLPLYSKKKEQEALGVADRRKLFLLHGNPPPPHTPTPTFFLS